MGNYEEEIDNNGNYRKLYYLPGGEALAGVYIMDNSGANMYYTYTDYLGSVLAVTKNNETTIHQEQRFDAWGRRRNLADWEYTSVSTIDIIDRGYTYHEHLNEFGIINMNGRLYDPVVGRMLSPDPQLQNPEYTQNYNRYSYVYNNPLKYSDPSGEWIANALMAIGYAYMSGVMQNGGEFNPGKWTKLDGASMTSAAINGWNSMGAVGLKKEMREYSDYLDNMYNENQFNYEQEILSDLDSRLIDGPGDDFYLDQATGEIQWIPGSDDWSDYGYIHLGGGLKDGVDVTASRMHKRGFWKAIWYSPIARVGIPDAFSLDFHLSSTAVKGGGITYSVQFITRGKDWGFHRTKTVHERTGLEVDYGFNANTSLFIGAPENLSFESTLGPTNGLSVGTTMLGLDFSNGYNSVNEVVPTWTTLGVGQGIGGGISYGTGNTTRGWWD